MNTKDWFVRALLSASLAVPSAFASKRAALEIFSVQEFFDAGYLTLDIYGENFTDGDERPEVTLGGVMLTVLDGWTDEFVSAQASLTFVPGDYLLVVTNHKGKTGEYDLTVGAVGPMGPPGPEGPWTVSGDDIYFLREGVDAKVGIGTADPRHTLDVNGDTRVTGVLEIYGGADVAEPFDFVAVHDIRPGMVVSIDPHHEGLLRLASSQYDRTVVGVVSGANGVEPGLTLRMTGGNLDRSHPVALTGRVWAWCDADAGGPIAAGDLLTTSGTPGHAMRVRNHDLARGAILGKAMSSLESGRGQVLILVALQ